ncbi:hypothetical protein LCGC14_2129920 [marine sediment metagenome]|uniref:Uncharacterized protein n=1 Tax=marine sediment metagenome TaxID=412755 RepID=A0A0F9GXW8_9ZZZZ
MAIVIIKEEDDMHSIFDAWDRGDHVLNKPGSKVYEALREKGSCIGNVMSDCTVCPTAVVPCGDASVLELYAHNPDKGHKAVRIRLCLRGISNRGECPLSNYM